jgi:hypothetical protein
VLFRGLGYPIIVIEVEFRKVAIEVPLIAMSMVGISRDPILAALVNGLMLRDLGRESASLPPRAGGRVL